MTMIRRVRQRGQASPCPRHARPEGLLPGAIRLPRDGRREIRGITPARGPTRRTPRHLAAGALLLLLSLSPLHLLTGSAATVGPSDFIVPCSTQVPVLLKILSYDRSLDLEQIDTVRIAVCFSPLTPPAVRERLEATLEEYAHKKINGRPFAYEVVVLSDVEEARHALTSPHPHVAYLAGVSDEVRNELLAVTRRQGTLTFSAMEDDVHEGVSVALAPAGEGSEILVNLEALKLEGHELQAGLLGICQIVRGSR